MREIKFRVWCCVDRWAYEVTFFSSGGWEARSGIEGYNENDGAILMQFTGLQDKNGKDIYEGDIVLGFDSGHYGKLQKMRIEYRLYPYIGFYMVPADGLRPHLFGVGDDIEVIGNLYEHPELMKETK